MKKGLTKTLMAVAVAIMAMQAMAMAPVIGNIPSPVVGNAENVTPAVGFVYPDAIDLTRYVSDLESASSQIIWSYTTATAAKYSINGKAALDISGGDNPVSPGAKALNSVAGGEADFDSNPLTITIRNTDLSPIVGAVGTDPGTPGILSGETQAVTLFASDQTTYSMKSVWFYTQDGGRDHLSPGLTPIYEYPGTYTATTGWRYKQIVGGAGISGSNGSGSQFCITTVQSSTTDVLARWASPYGDHNTAPLQLVANSAYRIRVTVSSSQTNVDNDPYWDLTVRNWDDNPVGSGGFNGGPTGGDGFGANFYFLSNVGGANAVTQSEGFKEFVFWWTPSPVSTAKWNDTSDTQPGPLAPSMLDWREFYIEFRILQSASNTGTNGARSSGTLCVRDVTVERVDMSAMQNLTPSNPVYNLTSITSAAVNTTGGSSGGGLGFTPVISGGTLTITPSGAGAGASGQFVANAWPGDGTVDYSAGGQNATADDFPCPMDPQTLYLVSMDLSAPSQNDMDHPPGVFWVGADCFTNELICLSWVTPVNFWHHAEPGLTPTTYKAFFYSNYGTAHGGLPEYSWYSIFRPRFQMGNDPGLAPGGGETKVGGIRIHNMRVDKVTFE